jgi:hypothetical protein
MKSRVMVEQVVRQTQAQVKECGGGVAVVVLI